MNQAPNPIDRADCEPPYYLASHEFNLAIRSYARPRSRQLILFSLGRKQILHGDAFGLRSSELSKEALVLYPFGVRIANRFALLTSHYYL